MFSVLFFSVTKHFSKEYVKDVLYPLANTQFSIISQLYMTCTLLIFMKSKECLRTVYKSNRTKEPMVENISHLLPLPTSALLPCPHCGYSVGAVFLLFIFEYFYNVVTSIGSIF